MSGFLRVFHSTNEQNIVGSACLVFNKYIITCAHVIQDALNLRDGDTPKNGDKISVDFPFAAKNKRKQAELIHWFREDDIAILTVLGDLPKDVSPAKLKSADDYVNHSVYIFGFTEIRSEAGDWVKGTFSETNIMGRIQINQTSDPNFYIEPGFSGGPVWDEQLSGVVGILDQVVDSKETKVAYCIPNDVIASVWHSLRDHIETPLSVAQKDYINYLQNTFKEFNWEGLALNLPPISISELFIPLKLTPFLRPRSEKEVSQSPDGTEVEPESTREILENRQFQDRPQQIIVLGNPGSGKSTLLKHLALELARQPGLMLPIIISLEEYANAVAKNHGLSLQQFISHHFGILLGVDDHIMGTVFEAAINRGKCIILLDGLDEVKKLEHLIRTRITSFVNTLKPGCSIWITSRPDGYERNQFDKSWMLYELKKFSEQDILQYLKTWNSLTKQYLPSRRKYSQDVRRFVDNAKTRRLISNPLNLMMFAATIEQDDLKNLNMLQRANLYSIFFEKVETLWNISRSSSSAEKEEQSHARERLKNLYLLAVWICEKTSPSNKKVTYRALERWLTDYYMGPDWGMKRGLAERNAQVFIEHISQYSNILVEDKDSFRFTTYHIQEAAAAFGLAELEERDPGTGIRKIQTHLADVKKGYLGNPSWNEIIPLTVGVLKWVKESQEKSNEAIEMILRYGTDRTTLLAGLCLEEIGDSVDEEIAERVISSLSSINLKTRASASLKRDAGFAIGRLAVVKSKYLQVIRPDLDEWVEYSSGTFRYDDDKFSKSIDYNFSFAKYPITNLQFRRFYNDKGYQKEKYWSDDGLRWKQGKYLDVTWRTRQPNRRLSPFYWEDERFNNPLSPVVGVTWFEAEAYCNWLSDRIQQEVRLPTDFEWERVARGQIRRAYPWGSKLNLKYLNSSEFWNNKINEASTTIVGQFPKGANPEGVQDLLGNVWEWTSTWGDLEKKVRIVRGGSWSNQANIPDRVSFAPYDYNYNVGIRLVRIIKK